jgi:hypothetical protein
MSNSELCRVQEMKSLNLDYSQISELLYLVEHPEDTEHTVLPVVNEFNRSFLTDLALKTMDYDWAFELQAR